MTQENLLPCPWCKNTPNKGYLTSGQGWTVFCANIECAIFNHHILRSKWQARPTPAVDQTKRVEMVPSEGELDLCMFNECPSGDELIRRRYAKAIRALMLEGK